ncbi:MAG: hypothetical protein JWQ90_1971 [Hydrocarboniphaga sp.]|uniref:hypothetical protein n=1 Tax=Hydrocarboniphaga sp. TaxID=2033016 RepID=UPI0026067E7F|nr:hypothetical protein [Hydrocarboniphaga sp.]MDB5969521.1 hypothetical protein [Hydrocarboniphaga sp.]
MHEIKTSNGLSNELSNGLSRGAVSRRRVLQSAALLPMALAAGSAQAQIDTNAQSVRTMGMIGVAAGQVLRVSLLNHNDTTAGWKIEVWARDGQLLAIETGELDAQRGSFVDFDLAARLKRGQRLQFHVDVTGVSRLPVAATAELFDSNGGNTVLSIQPCVRPEPDQLRTFASVGVVPGQILRVSLFQDLIEGAQSSPYRIDILDLDGQRLDGAEGSLVPGSGIVFSWNPGVRTLPRFGADPAATRQQVHVDVQVADVYTIGATLEVYHARTGRTQINISPCIRPIEVSVSG